MSSQEQQQPFYSPGQPKDTSHEEMQFADPGWQPQKRGRRVSRRDFLKVAGAAGGLVLGGGGLYDVYKYLTDAENQQNAEFNELLSRFRKEHIVPVQAPVVDNRVWTSNTAHVTVTEPDASGIGNIGLQIITDTQYVPQSSYDASSFSDVANFTLPDGSLFQPTYANSNGQSYLFDGRVVRVAPLSQVAPNGQFSEKTANLTVLQIDMGGIVEGQLPTIKSEGFTTYITRQPSNQNPYAQLSVQKDVTPLAAYILKIPRPPTTLASRPIQTPRR